MGGCSELMFGWWCPARLKANPAAISKKRTLKFDLLFWFSVVVWRAPCLLSKAYRLNRFFLCGVIAPPLTSVGRGFCLPLVSSSECDIVIVTAWRTGAMNSSSGHRSVPGRHKKPKRSISYHCISKVVGLNVLLLRAGSVIHLLVVSVNMSCFESRFCSIAAATWMASRACVCQVFAHSPSVPSSQWRHCVFALPLGIDIPACV